MSVTVHIPTPLRVYVAGKDAVEVEEGTVADILERLTRQYEKLKPHLFLEDGSLRGFVNIYVNERDMRELEDVRTPAVDGDELSIIPSIAGGATAVASPLPELTHGQILRYSRHVILPEVGMEGQRRLKAARVLLVGAGGLGFRRRSTSRLLELALSGWWILTSSTRRIFSDRSFTGRIVSGCRSWSPPKPRSAI